jgi:hypothetical protein
LFTTGYKRLAGEGWGFWRGFLIGWLWAACEVTACMMLLLLWLSYARGKGSMGQCKWETLRKLKREHRQCKLEGLDFKRD